MARRNYRGFGAANDGERESAEQQGHETAKRERGGIVDAAELSERADAEGGDAVADLIEGDQFARQGRRSAPGTRRRPG